MRRPRARRRRRRGATRSRTASRARSAIAAMGSKAPVFTLPGLEADDRSADRPGSACARRATSSPHPALAVGRQATTRSRPRPRYWRAAPSRRVGLVADDDVDLRRADRAHDDSTSQPTTLEDHVAGGGEGDDVARAPRRPSGRRRRRAGRPSRSSIQSPAICSTAAAAGDVAWRTGVLVPGRGQPVGGDRGRQRAADDEAEVARPGGRHEAGLDRAGHGLDDGDRVLPVLGQLTTQCRHDRLGVPTRSHRSVGQRSEVCRGQVGGSREQPLAAQRFGHVSDFVTMTRPRSARPPWLSGLWLARLQARLEQAPQDGTSGPPSAHEFALDGRREARDDPHGP